MYLYQFWENARLYLSREAIAREQKIEKGENT